MPPARHQSGQRIPDWLQERLKSVVTPPEPAQLLPDELPTPLSGQALVVAREQDFRQALHQAGYGMA